MKLKTKIKKFGVTSAWEENYKICDEFKRIFKTAEQKLKIQKLCELSKRVLRLEQKRSYGERRKKKHPIRKQCWVCKKSAFYQHHIILIKNGGFDSGINRIPICEKCHKEIHNWL